MVEHEYVRAQRRFCVTRVPPVRVSIVRTLRGNLSSSLARHKKKLFLGLVANASPSASTRLRVRATPTGRGTRHEQRARRRSRGSHAPKVPPRPARRRGSLPGWKRKRTPFETHLPQRLGDARRKRLFASRRVPRRSSLDARPSGLRFVAVPPARIVLVVRRTDILEVGLGLGIGIVEAAASGRERARRLGREDAIGPETL